MAKTSIFLHILPVLALAQAYQGNNIHQARQVSHRSFLPYDLQARDLAYLDDDIFEILARDVPKSKAPSGKAPSFMSMGKSQAAAPIVTGANSNNGKSVRLPSAEKKLESVEQSQVSTMHKIMNPKETMAGGEHAYYKQKIQNEFGSKYKQNYEQQRDTEIAKKNDRTKNYTAQQAENRKVLGENIKNAGDAVHVASEGLGVVKSALKPFKRRDVEEWDEGFVLARDIEDLEDDLLARDLEMLADAFEGMEW